jgi:manganese/zinc/iron transport system permease protein
MMAFLDLFGLPYNTRVVLEGAGLLGASAGVIGTFAVLRRRALVGDALAHASLPGLCLAFLVVGERDLFAMLTGALISGILGIAIIALLRRWTKIKEDAAVGTVLGVFFGAGIVLSSIIQRRPGGSRAGLESFILGKTAGMSSDDVHLVAILALGTLLLVLILYKEFTLIAFDPAFGVVQGWPLVSLDLVLMGLIAVAVVIGLPAVGVVMMAAVLIMPAAAARFWTERLSRLLALSALMGLGMGVGGASLSAWHNQIPAGPAVILTGTALFGLSAIFAPRRGLLRRAFVRRRRGARLDLSESIPEQRP